MQKVALFIGILIASSSTPWAADLMDVYRQALESDPLFKAAYSTFMSKTESIPQAASALLPQFGATSLISENAINVTAGLFSAKTTYGSEAFQLNASQSVFNLQAWAAVKQAKSAVKSAHAEFNNAAQDLMLRVAQAYFDALLSKDTLNFAEAKKRANKRQLDQARERFDVGVDTITSVYEAKAAYDQSIAEVIAAQNNQINQNENIRKLTNEVYEQLSPLRNSEVPLIKPEPNNVDDWIATGLNQNYKLLAAKFSLQAARENIKVQSAGNWPTLAITGSGAKTRTTSTGTDFFVPSNMQTAAVGISMNFPAYQGGLTESQTRQAQFDFQTSSEQLEKVYRDVVVNSRISFNTIVDGINKVKADRQTVFSRGKSLESTEAQFLVGTRTMVDVVNAQQRLFESQEQLASDQYHFIMSILNLKYLSGTLNASDLEEINAWLNTTRINGFPPKRALSKN